MTYSILGKDENGQIIQVDQGARREGMYIIGASGTGKSTLIQSLVLQDIEQGLGVCLLDPHGDLTNRILETMTKRVEDVILLDVANDQFPFGLNLFSCPYPNDIRWVQYTVNQVMHIFDRLYDISRATPNMSYFLRNCTYTIIANPGYTMAEIPMLLTNDGIRRHLVGNVTEQRVLRFWTEYERIVKSRWDYSNTVLPILNKLDEFLQPMLLHIVGQSQSTINLRRIMDERKLLFVKLDPRLEDMTTLIGSVIVAQVLNAAYSRGEMLQNKRKQMNLYCDEFEWFAGEDFMQLVSEARKFGIGTTVSNQTLSQIEDPIKENILQAATLVVFRVSGQDGEELATEFSAVPPPSETRREAVLVPKQNMLDHLLNNGHPNPSVAKFVTEYLQELKHDASIKIDYIYNAAILPGKSYFIRPLPDNGKFDPETDLVYYEYNPNILQTNLLKLNNLMYRAMLGEDFTNSLESICDSFADVLGYKNYFDAAIRRIDADTQSAFTNIQTIEREILTRKKSYAEAEQGVLDAEHTLKNKSISQIAQAKSLSLESAADLYESEYYRYHAFYRSLQMMLFALLVEPIMAESGRYEDKPLAPRPIADVEKEVAKFLSSPIKLPNLTAYAKTPTGEEKITIARSTGGMNRAAFQQRMREILSRNYVNGYLRPVAEVIEEITKRQRFPPPQPVRRPPVIPKAMEQVHDALMSDQMDDPLVVSDERSEQFNDPLSIADEESSVIEEAPAQIPPPPPQVPPLPPSRRRKPK